MEEQLTTNEDETEVLLTTNAENKVEKQTENEEQLTSNKDEIEGHLTTN
jgi:hypothetical protein